MMQDKGKRQILVWEDWKCIWKMYFLPPNGLIVKLLQPIWPSEESFWLKHGLTFTKSHLYNQVMCYMFWMPFISFW